MYLKNVLLVFVAVFGSSRVWSKEEHKSRQFDSFDWNGSSTVGPVNSQYYYTSTTPYPPQYSTVHPASYNPSNPFLPSNPSQYPPIYGYPFLPQVPSHPSQKPPSHLSQSPSYRPPHQQPQPQPTQYPPQYPPHNPPPQVTTHRPPSYVPQNPPQYPYPPQTPAPPIYHPPHYVPQIPPQRPPQYPTQYPPQVPPHHHPSQKPPYPTLHPTPVNPVVDQYDHRYPDGSYEFRYETPDETVRYERGYFIQYLNQRILIVKGYYSYRLPDLRYLTVFYSAGQYGYRQVSTTFTTQRPQLPRSLDVEEDSEEELDRSLSDVAPRNSTKKQ